MSTVVPNDATKLEESSSKHSAPQKILKSTYENILAALQENIKVILISGDNRKGKTALIHTVSKNIAATNRIITLSGKDLPSFDESKIDKFKKDEPNNNDIKLNAMKDFILESTELDDKLVVTLDDANCLPISFLGDLIEHAKLSSANGYSLQLILSGPLSFKDQLLAIQQVDVEDLIHCPMDSLNEQEILAYAKDKSYKITSNIKRLEFKSESLRALSDFVQTNQQLLDVVLEWCAALAKKDQLTSISSFTVNRAASFAQQFSKDKNLRLVNSYPPSHEVYKYINDIQSSKKPTDKVTTKVTKKSVKKLNKNTANKPFIRTSNTTAVQETKIPTITSKVEPSNPSIKAEKLDRDVLQNLHEIVEDEEPIQAQPIDEDTLKSLYEIEEEIMPPQWTPSSKQKTSNKKSFPTMVGLLSLLLLGFITFIAFRIGSDPKVDENIAESPDKQNVVDETQKTIIEEPTELVELSPITSTIEDASSVGLINQEVEISENPKLAPKPLAGPQPGTGIIASDTETTVKIGSQAQNPKPISEKNINTNEQANERANEQTEVVAIKKPEQKNKVLDEELAKNEQEYEKQLKAQQTENIKTESSATENKSSVVSDAEITKLLVLAENQFENKHLSTPSGDNAIETYKKILAKHPNNKAAINGIKKVHDKYMSWANYYLKQNDTKRAKNFYNKALRIDPNNTVAIANLQNIAQQQAAVAETKTANTSNPVVLQDAIPSNIIQDLLVTANKKMQQIESDISSNKRNYRTYQEAQTAYQETLKSQPQNQQAIQGLSALKKYYANWAELQVQNKNYNIALFLYSQALSIEPGNAQITQRIERIRELKKSL